MFFINLFLAVILFFLNGLLGRFQSSYREFFKYEKFSFISNPGGSYSGEFLQKIVNPAFFITIVCVVLQIVNRTEIISSLWITVLLYWMLRFMFYFLRGRLRFLNWQYEVFSFVISNALSSVVLFACLVPLIESNETVFISLESLRDAIWFAIISYIVKIIWDIGKYSLKANTILPESRKERIVFEKYNNFSKKYDVLIDKELECCPYSDDIRMLIYSIMVYEDFNRPFIFRKAENMIKFLNPDRKMTMGVMQIFTEKYISDEESVELASKKIKNAYIENIGGDPMHSAISDYNSTNEYYGEVIAIYDMLKGKVY